MDAVFIRNSIMNNFENVFRLKEINGWCGGVTGKRPSRKITLRTDRPTDQQTDRQRDQETEL